MIHIPRQRTDERGRPIAPGAAWRAKAKAATDEALLQKQHHEVAREIYAAAVVKKALEKLFYRKCAYCETDLARVEWEVEHYRPKGSVHGEKHSGYYWLAYRWDNLFPACKYCNQWRRDPGTWDHPDPGDAGGKADHFPIAGQRATAPEHDLAAEEPLLLNPCIDDPEAILTYLANGAIQAVEEDPRGRASIRYYHLDLTRLREAREDRILEILGFVKLLRGFRNRGLTQAADEIEEVLKRNYCADHAPYAAVGRAVLRDPNAFGLEG